MPSKSKNKFFNMACPHSTLPITSKVSFVLYEMFVFVSNNLYNILIMLGNTVLKSYYLFMLLIFRMNSIAIIIPVPQVIAFLTIPSKNK